MPEKIGWSGKSLNQMLEESEKLMKETGAYYGLKELRLKKSNTIMYEKIWSRLRGGLVNARETALNIASSPITKEIGELVFMLYTPEGDCITLSTGILAHVHTTSDAIKYMIRHNYEENPGVKVGDIFCNNDTFCGDIQNADVQTILPIFWKNELVGWAAGVTHVLDVGATTPGSDVLGPINRFEDGIVISCERIGENDSLYSYYLERVKQATRTPNFWALDERTRIAGCFMIRDAINKIIEQVGIETYKEAVREFIEEGRLSFIRKIKEMLIPGKYQSSSFVDVPLSHEKRLPERAAKDWLMHLPSEIEIGVDGSFTFSFDGASEWLPQSVNGTPSAWQGGLWISIAQTLMANERVNDGAYLATKQYFPLGSWSNPGNQQAATSMSWYPLYPVFTTVFRALSRAFQARGYIEEVLAGYGNTANEMQGGGLDLDGKSFAFLNFNMACTGSGAGMIRDGINFGQAVWNPMVDKGDAEAWEIVEPLIYLSECVKPDTAGAGKFRGGSGWETLRMAWKVNYLECQFIGEGFVFCSQGIFGGYPASTGYRLAVHKSNMFQLIRQGKPYPTRDGTPDNSEVKELVKGKFEYDKIATTLPEIFENGDLYLNYMRGGPGLGDPLEREPQKVVEDVNEGFVSAKFAKSIYGVVIDCVNGTWVADSEKTKLLRKDAKTERGKKAVPVSEWWKKERQKVLDKSIPSLSLDMLKSSMKLSANWEKKFKDFWKLPKNFQL